MPLNRFARWIVLIAMVAGVAYAQGSAPAAPQSNEAAAADPVLLEAESLIGKSLFLRGFFSNNDLKYDAAGKAAGSPGSEDWTLCGINLLKATRKGPTELQLEGVRVAVRYNPDAHEFQRHPLNDQKIQIVMAAPVNTRSAEAAFGAMFSFGIDPALQRSMPDYWRHYFDTSLAWPNDSLGEQTIYPLYGQADQPKDVTPPKPMQSSEAPKFTPFAERDRVQGSVVMRVVVDAQGVPRRIWLALPLGYGLDERAVQTVSKWRFAPAMREGTPVAAGVYVEQKFVLPPPVPARR
jgi:TonB family protein